MDAQIGLGSGDELERQAREMSQEARLDWLLDYLRHDHATAYAGGAETEVPTSTENRQKLLRALMNVRQPEPVTDEFLAIQDAYLQQRLIERGGVTHVTDLAPVSAEEGDLYIWQGDITLIDADGIVNVANSQMLGCFRPLHGCIDNAINTYAGVQLRLEMAEVMVAQGHEEPVGQAKISSAYNLPARHVLHTVGPVVQTLSGRPSAQNRRDLAGCYTSCLDLAAANGLGSLAFCCISTGVFGYPNRDAAEVAVSTVRAWKRTHDSSMKVIFNVFKSVDDGLYRQLLTAR